MTHDEPLQRKLADWRPDGKETKTMDLADGWTVSLTADCVDQLSASFWEVGLRHNPPLTTDLEARADKLAQKITVLLEPLSLIEVDTPRGSAQLRSEAPRQRGEQLAYYELVLSADGASCLHRYQASRGAGRREQVP